MSPLSLTCDEILFLAVPILRRTIFGRVLLAVSDIFGPFIFLGGLLFLACLFLVGMVTMQDNMWQLQVTTYGNLRL
jgi:hypothetical protein